MLISSFFLIFISSFFFGSFRGIGIGLLSLCSFLMMFFMIGFFVMGGVFFI